jgi:hypothetical protein
VCLANQALRGQNVSMLQGIFGNPYDGPYWQARAPERLVGDIVVPTLLVNAWQDEQTGGGPAKLLERFPDTTPARLLGTNGDHGEYYRGDVWAEIVRFLDVYLGDQDPAQVAAYEAEDPGDDPARAQPKRHRRRHVRAPELRGCRRRPTVVPRRGPARRRPTTATPAAPSPTTHPACSTSAEGG